MKNTTRCFVVIVVFLVKLYSSHGHIFVSHEDDLSVFGQFKVRYGGYAAQGKMRKYSSVQSNAKCVIKCLRLKVCTGFQIVQSTCHVIVPYPGPLDPDAAGVGLLRSPSKDHPIWILRTAYLRSCLDIKIWFHGAGSGKYWIWIPGTDSLQPVYCDMTTASGGWTLVWSYGFTNCADFTGPTNAVEPVPSLGWTTGSTNVHVSKTTPTDPGIHGAMEFNMWSKIGKQFLIRSNINNEYVCSPANGSVVEAKTGSISCALVQDIVESGCIAVPNWYQDELNGYGPALMAGSDPIFLFIWWDGSTSLRWPTHDPCGMNTASHKTGVSNPGGQLYLSNYPTSCADVKTKYPWVGRGQYWILEPGAVNVTVVDCDI